VDLATEIRDMQDSWLPFLFDGPGLDKPKDTWSKNLYLTIIQEHLSNYHTQTFATHIIMFAENLPCGLMLRFCFDACDKLKLPLAQGIKLLFNWFNSRVRGPLEMAKRQKKKIARAQKVKEEKEASLRRKIGGSAGRERDRSQSRSRCRSRSRSRSRSRNRSRSRSRSPPPTKQTPSGNAKPTHKHISRDNNHSGRSTAGGSKHTRKHTSTQPKPANKSRNPVAYVTSSDDEAKDAAVEDDDDLEEDDEEEDDEEAEEEVVEKTKKSKGKSKRASKPQATTNTAATKKPRLQRPEVPNDDDDKDKADSESGDDYHETPVLYKRSQHTACACTHKHFVHIFGTFMHVYHILACNINVCIYWHVW
jgi:hypothetical protein